MPSLYESTVNTGEVSSSNFTTLYNASGLQVPNAGAGSITGNLNVGGNLIVQGTSLLQGAVTLGSTLSTPNYTFPLPDGTTDQVLVTDGSGNLYWTDVSAIPGAAYQIQANTTSGGANLTLVDSAGGTDSVKFAGGTNVTVVRTDANTITINSSADDIPDGTAQGQVLYWNGSAWTANSTVTSVAPANRFVAEYLNNTSTVGSSAFFRRNYGSTAYASGLTSAIAFQFDSDSQAIATQGAIGTGYDAANPSIFGATSIDNFTSRTLVFDIDSTDIKFDGINLVLNANLTGTSIDPLVGITVNRGTDPDATLQWDEVNDYWIVSNNLQVSGTIACAGDSITINSDNTAVDSLLNFNTSKYLKWDVTGADPGYTLGPQFELNGNLYIDNTDPYLTFRTQADGVNNLYGVRGSSTIDDPWFVGGGSTGDDQGYMVIATGDNASSPGLASPIYVRQYAGSGTSLVPWYGGAATLVNELTLLNGDGNTLIPNNLTVDSGTLFVNAANNRVGINNTNPQYELHVNSSEAGPNDIVQLALTNSERDFIITSNTVDNLLSFSYNGANRLQFDLTNQWFNSGRLGINTATPSRTLSVAGDADVTGDVSAGSFTIDGGGTTIDTVTTTTVSTIQTAIATTSNTTTRSSKFQIQITNNVTGNVHVLEALVFFQGTTAYLTTYAEMYNSTRLATFAADVSGGNTRLLATPASANNTTFKVTRISVAL